MRLALLSDIHGNITALEKILNELNKYDDLEGIVIAGDSIGDGPKSSEVLERLRKFKTWIIKGNREEDIIDYQMGRKKEWDYLKQFASMKWTFNSLKEEQLVFIKELANQIVIDIPGTSKIRVVHGSPRDVYEHLFPDKLIERLDYATRMIDEEYLVCGHSHRHWIKLHNDKLIINPGSVGQSFNKHISTEYSILEWKDSRWKHSHHYAKYDIEKAIDDFYKTGLSEYGGFWVEVTIMSLRESQNYMVGFVKFIKDKFFGSEYKIDKFIPNELWDKGIKLWRECENKPIHFD